MEYCVLRAALSPWAALSFWDQPADQWRIGNNYFINGPPELEGETGVKLGFTIEVHAA
jgi:hypothetical protein